MTDIIQTTPIALPEARVPITIRPGTIEDVPFMDALQKKTTKQVGWMPTKQFEGKVVAGHVLVAEATGVASGQWSVTREDEQAGHSSHSPLTTSHSRVGYLIGNDQYFKRDDVGIIYQINVIPEMRRSLVAASLLKAQFERSAYGCRLYCCWCAQDIEANRFWESMGFVPLAYRAGSLVRGAKLPNHRTADAEVFQSEIGNRKSAMPRVHIFWQKRIRNGDTSTPWWFPSKTDGGAIRADRIVLPIPPGTHWSDAKPLILPAAELPVAGGQLPEKTDTRRKDALTTDHRPLATRGAKSANRQSEIGNRQSPAPRALSGGMSFAPPVVVKVETSETSETSEKPKRERKPKVKTDPRLIAAARELKDRYLEQINDGSIVPMAKYEVSRQIETSRPAMPLLAA